MALTEDAKKELDDAIRIVREDRFEKFVRENHGKTPTPVTVEEVKDELVLPDDGKTPPPAKKETTPPDNNLPPKRNSAYWGELDD